VYRRREYYGKQKRKKLKGSKKTRKQTREGEKKTKRGKKKTGGKESVKYNLE
jgi:hypothetical protein